MWVSLLTRGRYRAGCTRFNSSFGNHAFKRSMSPQVSGHPSANLNCRGYPPCQLATRRKRNQSGGQRAVSTTHECQASRCEAEDVLHQGWPRRGRGRGRQCGWGEWLWRRLHLRRGYRARAPPPHARAAAAGDRAAARLPASGRVLVAQLGLSLCALCWAVSFSLQRSTKTMLVMGGSEDPLISEIFVRQTADHYSSEFRIVPGADHSMMLGSEWEKSAEALKDWLSRNVS